MPTAGQRAARARVDGWELQGHAEWSPDGTQILSRRTQVNTQISFSMRMAESWQVTDRGGTTSIRAGHRTERLRFHRIPNAFCQENDFEVYTVAVRRRPPRLTT